MSEPQLSHKGLTGARANELLILHGHNELPSSKPRSVFSFLMVSLREPMIALLLACASIYFFLGDINDSLLLLFSVLGVVGISFYQEYRSGRALEALRDLTSPRARVLRDGVTKRIAGRDVVRGDYLILSEGDRIPADGRLIESSHFQADESLLTGESVPVEKTMSGIEASTKKVFASTLVTRGTGVAIVTATATHTEIGKIGRLLSQAPEERTRLQNEMTRIVQVFGLVAILFSFLIAAAYFFKDESWPKALLAGLAAAMALLPEEFPVILTVFLALGAWRLSKKNILIRQPTATESLGAVTALCVDKTGTLTLNLMTVTRLQGPLADNEIVQIAALASQKDPFDPMEKAILNAFKESSSIQPPLENWETMVREYPLSPKLLAMSRVWQSHTGQPLIVAAKGAPEAILHLCRKTSPESKSLLQAIDQMSNEGLRVIAVAKAKCSTLDTKSLPNSQEEFDFEFVGVIGLRDPVRPEVPEAISECLAAGVRVIMITGDYPGTALQIAKTAGLKHPEKFLSGSDIEQMSDLELCQRVRDTNIFARMVPNQKLRIVNALKTNGEVVAMTGDGVNDAPSLKWADIGIAMGQRGTDVAREASDIVLLDDCFTSIVVAIRMGRKIFENIRHAIAYVFSVHVPIAGMASLPILLGLPPALFPAHIVFMELIIDPTCSLIFESLPPGPGTMRRPPRSLQSRIFNRSDLFRSTLQGAIMLLPIIGTYYFSLKSGSRAEEARTLAFAIFVFTNLGLIAVNQIEVLKTSYSQFFLVAALATTALLVTIYTPFLREIFGFAAMQPSDWLLAMSLAIAAALAAWGVGHLTTSSGQKIPQTEDSIRQ